MVYRELPWRQEEHLDPNDLIDERPKDVHLEAEYEDRITPWDADPNPYDGGLTTDDADFVLDGTDNSDLGFYSDEPY